MFLDMHSLAIANVYEMQADQRETLQKLQMHQFLNAPPSFGR